MIFDDFGGNVVQKFWQRVCKLWQGECCLKCCWLNIDSYGEDDDDDEYFIMIMEVLLDHESFHCSLAGAQIYQLPLPHTHCTLCTVYNTHSALYTHLHMYSTYWSWHIVRCTQFTCTTHSTLDVLHTVHSVHVQHTLYLTHCTMYSIHCACLT